MDQIVSMYGLLKSKYEAKKQEAQSKYAKINSMENEIFRLKTELRQDVRKLELLKDEAIKYFQLSDLGQTQNSGMNDGVIYRIKEKLNKK